MPSQKHRKRRSRRSRKDSKKKTSPRLSPKRRKSFKYRAVDSQSKIKEIRKIVSYLEDIFQGQITGSDITVNFPQVTHMKPFMDRLSPVLETIKSGEAPNAVEFLRGHILHLYEILNNLERDPEYVQQLLEKVLSNEFPDNL